MGTNAANVYINRELYAPDGVINNLSNYQSIQGHWVRYWGIVQGNLFLTSDYGYPADDVIVTLQDGFSEKCQVKFSHNMSNKTETITVINTQNIRSCDIRDQGTPFAGLDFRHTLVFNE